MKITNIYWDTDGETDVDLPTEVDLPSNIINNSDLADFYEDISNYLYDKFGYCQFNFSVTT